MGRRGWPAMPWGGPVLPPPAPPCHAPWLGGALLRWQPGRAAAGGWGGAGPRGRQPPSAPGAGTCHTSHDILPSKTTTVGAHGCRAWRCEMDARQAHLGWQREGRALAAIPSIPPTAPDPPLDAPGLARLPQNKAHRQPTTPTPTHLAARGPRSRGNSPVPQSVHLLLPPPLTHPPPTTTDPPPTHRTHAHPPGSARSA